MGLERMPDGATIDDLGLFLLIASTAVTLITLLVVIFLGALVIGLHSMLGSFP
jgi:hypothetical protein